MRRSEDGPYPRPSISPRSRNGCAPRCRVRCGCSTTSSCRRSNAKASRCGSASSTRRPRPRSSAVRRYVFPVLTPLAVDSGHPFPYISNLSLSLAVELEEATSDGVELHFARVKIPPTLPRFVPVEGAAGRRFVLLEDLIAHHLDGLFPGMHVAIPISSASRATPTSICRKTKPTTFCAQSSPSCGGGASASRCGWRSNAECPSTCATFSAARSSSSRVDCYEIEGLMALSDLWQIVNLRLRGNCEISRTCRRFPSGLIGVTDIFAQIREGDMLLHHPYESFDP